MDLENGSAAESVASSLSAPNLSIEKGGEDAVVEDDEVDSVAALKSILRKHEDSILKKEALFGGGASKSSQSRARWAAIFDERSASSHSGSTKSSSTQASGSSSSSPGAYNVIPDVSGGVVVMLREMWRRKETDGSSKNTVWSSEDLLTKVAIAVRPKITAMKIAGVMKKRKAAPVLRLLPNLACTARHLCASRERRIL